MLKSSRFLMVVLLPSRVSSFTFHLEQPAGATEPADVSGRYSMVARSTGARVPLAVGAISIEGVGQKTLMLRTRRNAVMTSIIAIADPGSIESIKAALSHEH